MLDTLPVETVPWYAAAWLLDGHDSHTLRELAGLNGRDPHAVRDLLPAALAEIGIALPTTDLAAATDAFRHLAELCLAGRAGERWVARWSKRSSSGPTTATASSTCPSASYTARTMPGKAAGANRRGTTAHRTRGMRRTDFLRRLHPILATHRRRAGHEALPMSEY